MKKKIIPVVIGVIKKDNKYLLTKRIHGDKRYHDKWQFPGGEVNYGESLIDALNRELKEELNVQIEIIKQVPLVFEKIEPDWHGIFITFICKLKKDGALIKLNHEASKFKWFSKEEILQLDTLAGIKELLNLI